MANSVIARLKLHQMVQECEDIAGLKALARHLIEREAFIKTNFSDLLELDKQN